MAGEKKVNTMLDNIDCESGLNFYGIDLIDEKEFSTFIKKSEALCRKSQEYDIWQKRTKALAVNQNQDDNKNDAEKCPICGIEYQYAPAESHHHPITLFKLCVITFQDWIDNNELDNKRPLDLIQEVMDKHLCNEVEHVVLCKHCHEKYHNGEININNELQKIIDYKRSIKFDNMPQTVQEIISKKIEKEKYYRKQRRESNAMVLGTLQNGVNKDSISNDILDMINNRII